MKVSLILATFGRTEEVGRAIRSIAAQTDLRVELLVIDQNRDDRLSPFLKEGEEAGLEIVHLRLDRPSLSGARNLGLKWASGDVVAFPDDDCWYQPDTVGSMLSVFAASDSIDGVIGHWVEQTAGKSPPEHSTLSIEAWRRFRDGNASSITIFLKTDLVRRLGGFDERLGVGRWFGAAEETDLILRVLTSGARLVSSPNVRVHHHYSTQSGGPLLERCRSVRSRSRGTGAIYVKHKLSSWVIVRGLVAPVIVPLLRADFGCALCGIFMSVGRAEGMIRWKLEEE